MHYRLNKFNIRCAKEQHKNEEQYYEEIYNIKCSFCKEKGHVVNICGEITCPKLRKNKCKLCKQTGHTPKFCKSLNKKQKQTENIESVCRSCYEPVCSMVEFNGRCFTCCRDTICEDNEADDYYLDKDYDDEYYQCYKCGTYSNNDAKIGLCGGCRK